MPQGTLRQAICYPDRKVSDDELIALMRLCHLHKWVGELDTVADYQLVMSPGELQRVAFVRVFLQNPTLLCLDEATSALDEALEQTLYQTLLERLPECIIISIGHRSTLHKYHNRQILLVKAGDFD